MSSLQKVAVVTGSNKGIGYGIVKGLCERFKGIVYLTARDQRRGDEAVESLKKMGFDPKFHLLDINDTKSIETLRDYLKKNYGGLDLLVNNAAIAFSHDSTVPYSEQANQTVSVNYFSTLNVCEILFPILRQDARVVNVSSSSGHLSRIPSKDLREKFLKTDLTVPELNSLIKDFLKDADEGKAIENGWGPSTYVISKVGLSALTFIQQRQLDKESEKRNISVNAVHPGYVDTDMSNHKGDLTIEQGAYAPLHLALDVEQSLKGRYVWFDGKVVDWNSESTPKTNI